MTVVLRCGLICMSILMGGCYLSHGLDDADVGRPDGGGRPDVGRPDVGLTPDTPTACLPADRCNPAFVVREGTCGPPPRVLEDGFEDASVSFGNPVGSVLSCWEVVAGDADIVGDGAGFEGPSDTGEQALDLNGWTSGTIARTVRVVPGRSYLLRFAFTRNPQMDDPTATGELLIDGAVLGTLSASPRNTASDLMWAYDEVPLIARGPTLTIALRSTNPGNGGLYLDSFTLDEQ